MFDGKLCQKIFTALSFDVTVILTLQNWIWAGKIESQFSPMYLINSGELQSWDIEIIVAEVNINNGITDGSAKSLFKTCAIKKIVVRNSIKNEVTWPDNVMTFFFFLWRRLASDILPLIPSSCFHNP